MYHIDVKHMLLSSSRLRNFKQKGDNLWNCSCPVCGDSASNARKARLYFFRHEGKLFAKCHNCQYSASFTKFLQFLDPSQHKDYTYEKFLAKNHNSNTLEPLADVTPQNVLETLRVAQELSIPSIASLPEGHPARAYIASRKIPEEFWEELYFAQNYRSFLDLDFPKHGKEDVPDDARIVLPVSNDDNYISYVIGRALNKNAIRYVTIKLLDEKKIYGLNRFNGDHPFYIVEGPIDSLFLPNCLASADANLIGVAEHMKKQGYSRSTLLFDNTPRNKVICQQMQLAIELGFRISILPHSDEGKDLNDLAVGGWTPKQIHDFIDGHSYHGNRALFELMNWRRA
jgi:hypothetical protein